MADGDAGGCEPYRVEVRSDLASPWRRFGDGRSTLPEAEARARHAVAYHGRQARVVEQRVVLVRGLGQDGGPDQPFVDFAARNLKAAARQAADTMATADGVVRASQASRMSSSEPEESEQAMPDGLLFSERELWKAAAVVGFIDGGDMLDVLARLARVRAELRACHGPSVVSDPDDRRDVEAAADADQPMTVVDRTGWASERVRDGMTDALLAIEREIEAAGCTVNDGRPIPEAIIEGVHLMRERVARLPKIEATFCLAENSYGMLCDRVPGHDPPHHYTGDGGEGNEPMDGEPLDQARTILNQLADSDTQRQAIRDATVTDTVGCAHRMSSGAVSLTTCGECGAEPGDDCADTLEDRIAWHADHAPDREPGSRWDKIDRSCRDGWLTGDPLLPAEPRTASGKPRWQLWRHGLRASELYCTYRWRWAARVALALAPFDGHIQRSDEPHPHGVTTRR